MASFGVPQNEMYAQILGTENPEQQMAALTQRIEEMRSSFFNYSLEEERVSLQRVQDFSELYSRYCEAFNNPTNTMQQNLEIISSAYEMMSDFISKTCDAILLASQKAEEFKAAVEEMPKAMEDFGKQVAEQVEAKEDLTAEDYVEIYAKADADTIGRADAKVDEKAEEVLDSVEQAHAFVDNGDKVYNSYRELAEDIKEFRATMYEEVKENLEQSRGGRIFLAVSEAAVESVKVFGEAAKAIAQEIPVLDTIAEKTAGIRETVHKAVNFVREGAVKSLDESIKYLKFKHEVGHFAEDVKEIIEDSRKDEQGERGEYNGIDFVRDERDEMIDEAFEDMRNAALECLRGYETAPSEKTYDKMIRLYEKQIEEMARLEKNASKMDKAIDKVEDSKEAVMDVLEDRHNPRIFRDLTMAQAKLLVANVQKDLTELGQKAEVLENVGHAIKDKMDTLKEGFTKIVDKAKEVIGKVVEQKREEAKETIEDIEKTAKGFISRVKEAAKDLADKVADHFKNDDWREQVNTDLLVEDR